MSALHYRPPAAGGPLLRSECLAWVSQPAILQPRAVMRTGDTTRELATDSSELQTASTVCVRQPLTDVNQDSS